MGVVPVQANGSSSESVQEGPTLIGYIRSVEATQQDGFHSGVYLRYSDSRIANARPSATLPGTNDWKPSVGSEAIKDCLYLE